MVKKTAWECPKCGRSFNSRASRLYHQRHTSGCEPDPAEDAEQINTQPEPHTVTYPDPEIVEIDCEIADLVSAPAEAIKNAIVPDKPRPEIRPAPAPASKPKAKAAGADDEDEDDPEEEMGIPWMILIPVMILLLMLAGALLFHDKITAFYRQHMTPPRPPTPAPAGGEA